jgi:hypothetical protein
MRSGSGAWCGRGSGRRWTIAPSRGSWTRSGARAWADDDFCGEPEGGAKGGVSHELQGPDRTRGFCERPYFAHREGAAPGRIGFPFESLTLPGRGRGRTQSTEGASRSGAIPSRVTADNASTCSCRLSSSRRPTSWAGFPGRRDVLDDHQRKQHGDQHGQRARLTLHLSRPHAA